jgi:hypothetical protein
MSGKNVPLDSIRRIGRGAAGRRPTDVEWLLSLQHQSIIVAETGRDKLRDRGFGRRGIPAVGGAAVCSLGIRGHDHQAHDRRRDRFGGARFNVARCQAIDELGQSIGVKRSCVRGWRQRRSFQDDARNDGRLCPHALVAGHGGIRISGRRGDHTVRRN